MCLASSVVPDILANLSIRSFASDLSPLGPDLPVELSNDTVKSAFSTYGEVYSVHHGFFKDFPDLQNGNRLILMSISNPIPSLLNVLGFVCRAWHPGQPVYCTICKESGHSPRTCPLSGLCRRCKQPGHVARECGQGRGQPHPSSLVPVDPVPAPVPVPEAVPVLPLRMTGNRPLSPRVIVFRLLLIQCLIFKRLRITLFYLRKLL